MNANDKASRQARTVSMGWKIAAVLFPAAVTGLIAYQAWVFAQ